MVSTIDHLATCAGVDLLRKGGSAADAAVGANAVLAVTSPHMCGPGGDVWALVHDGGSGPPAALDSAGFAGAGADAERVRSEGLREIPLRGHLAAVTVPGAVDGWLALHSRYGRLPLADVLAEAVRIADDGFAASPLLADRAGDVAGVDGNTDIGDGLRPGAVVRRPGTARAFRAVIERGRDGFYGGEFGEGLIALGAGEYAEADLVRPIARWVDPVRAEAFGRCCGPCRPHHRAISLWRGRGSPTGSTWATPVTGNGPICWWSRPRRPGTTGCGSSTRAPTVRRWWTRPASVPGAMPSTPNGPETWPLPQPRATPPICARWTATAWACRSSTPTPAASARIWWPAPPASSCTIGGIGFSLVPGHPAEYAPGRRPPHTLAPALVTNRDGSLRQVLGTMGGDSQPQILLQLLARTLGLGQSPGAALRAPRWVLCPDGNEAGSPHGVPARAAGCWWRDSATGLARVARGPGHATALLEGEPPPLRPRPPDRSHRVRHPRGRRRPQSPNWSSRRPLGPGN